MSLSLPSLAFHSRSLLSRCRPGPGSRLPQPLSGFFITRPRPTFNQIRIHSITRHHSQCFTHPTMSAPGSTTTSRKQPPWRVPEGKPVPKLKLYNSMTRTKVNGV